MLWIFFFALIGAIAVWLLGSALYKPIGKFWHRVLKDAIDSMNENEENKNEESKKEK